MQVIKNYLYNASYQLFILIVPLLTTPYLARVLGPKGVGINAFTGSNVQYFIIFGSIGVNLYGNRQIAFERDSKEKLTNTFYELFLMKLITITITYIVFLLFLMLEKKYFVYYLAQSISIIAAAFDVSWFFMGVENFGVTVIRNFIVKIVTLISVFTFVKSYNDLPIYILIFSLSLLLGNLSLFPNLKRYIGRPNFKHIHIWRHLAPSLVLFVPQIATQLYVVVNKTMLGVIGTVQSSGFFDQSDKIVKLVLAIVTATGSVMLPHVANAFKNGEFNKTKEFLYNSFSFVTALSVPMMFGLAAITPKFVPLFFTKSFISVTPLLMIESIVILMIAWSNVIGAQYLVPTNQNRYFTTSIILGAISNIIINIPLILMLGTKGSIISTVISEVVVTGYQLIILKNQINYSKLFTDTWKYLLSGLLMFVIVFRLDQALPQTWTMILIEVAVGGIVYIILLFILRAKIIKDGFALMRH